MVGGWWLVVGGWWLDEERSVDGGGAVMSVIHQRFVPNSPQPTTHKPTTSRAGESCTRISASNVRTVPAFGPWDDRAAAPRSLSWLVIGGSFLANCVCKGVHQPPITNNQQPALSYGSRWRAANAHTRRLRFARMKISTRSPVLDELAGSGLDNRIDATRAILRYELTKQSGPGRIRTCDFLD